MRHALIGEGDGIPSAADPLGTGEFAALMQAFAPFRQPRRFAVAVSGGPDSMALAYCVWRFVTTNTPLTPSPLPPVGGKGEDLRSGEDGGGISIFALIVDHGLRPESAKEAEETQKKLDALGILAEILRWEHAPVVTRLHATARKARYRLLTEACHYQGISDLMLAHQREDQAETILMRLAKGSGIDGLAGMSTQSTMDGVRLLRPFLKIPKERLIATCTTAGLGFIEDASNRSEKFARGRLRKVMPLLAEEGLTVERLTDLGARAADAKDALDHYTHAFLHAASKRDEAGVIRIDLEQLHAVPRAIAARALALCLQAVHAEDYASEHVSLMRIVDTLRGAKDMTPRTLHGCLVSKSETQVTLMREVAAITDTPIIHPGESVAWDGRWNVTLDKGAAGSFAIRPLGELPHEVLDTLAPGLRKFVPQGRARASLPGLWDGDKLAGIPSLKDSGSTWAQLVSGWPPGY